MYYELSDSIGKEDLSKRISTEFTAISERSVKQKKRYLDTFDFKLCNEGFYFLCDKKSFILHNSHFDKSIAEIPAAGKKEPKFWWDLPSCTLRQELKQRIEVRALLPIIEVEKITTPMRILNEDSKTVLTLTLEEIKAAGENKSTITHMCLRPIRGYRGELNEFKSYLAELNLKESQGDYLRALLQSIGKDPKDFSSKLRIELTPELTSLEALRLIMKHLLRTIKLNEEGIIKDIDIEFLHDFRVAVRRTRSALSQIKGVFPDDVTEKFRAGFSNLGRMTNHLRDLDIYMLDKDRYRSMLPEELNPGLEQMYLMFKNERKRAHKEIVKALKSKEYKEFVESWEGFLNEQKDIASASNSGAMVKEMAGRIIKRKYRRVVRDGSRINKSTPDPELHKLRIECKKLRYMIEFFSSLYPVEDIKSLIRHLKILQDNLGEFNDLSVQRVSLKSFVDKLDHSDEQHRECIVSSGGLISVLFERQKEVRSHFTERFKEFQDKETKAIFKKLFNLKPVSHS